MNPPNEVRSYGPSAVLVTPGGGVRPADFASAVVRGARPEVVEVVPAAATVLIAVADRASHDDVADWLADLDVTVDGPEGGGGVEAAEIVLDVVYDGADLASVADGAGLSIDDVIARHSAGVYSCDFCGFAPGFAYLSGIDSSLVLPRRSTPRTSVPAGSVAIAGAYSAVYPSSSPGGWHLLGHTDAVLFDPASSPPALITPGTRVRFRPVPRSGRRESRIARLTTTRTTGGTEDNQMGEGRVVLRVISPGWAASFQDAGRPGLATIGVPASGALDRRLRELVNRLVGNPSVAAVLETAGRIELEAVSPVVMADSSSGVVRTLAAGERVHVDARPGELWAYIAIRGGFDVQPVLGSRSWDSLSGLGPPPVQRGDDLTAGPDPRTTLATDLAPPTEHVGAPILRVWPGPGLEWFADDAFARMLAAEWTVSPDASRVGVRLKGPPLARRAGRADEELPSEGIVTGAIQVPPDGQPVVMLADHPTTGGYPVIGVVDDRDLVHLVNARPGTVLRWKEVTG